MPTLEVALDISTTTIGVVDDDADRQHQAEQREVVERIAEPAAARRQRADQRDRDRHHRDDRRAPFLQEDDDHEHDEQDRLAQRVIDRRRPDRVDEARSGCR